jgi:hypothetical protein
MSANAHLFVGLVAIVCLIVMLSLVRRRRMSSKYVFLWLSVGAVMLLLAVSPRLLDRISVLIGIDYGPTTLFLFALVFLLLISVHFSWELSRLEDRTRRLAEEAALLRAESELHDERKRL